MVRTESEPGPGGEGKLAKDVAGATDDGTERPPSAVPEGASLVTNDDVAAAPPTSSQPTGTTPGGSSLAARLLQNRTKSGKQKILEDATVAERSRPSSGSFELAEPTAVEGTSGAEVKPASSPVEGAAGSGTVAGAVAAEARVPHPTPGGGLPGLLARTQLGLGDDVRAALAAIRGRTPSAAPATGSAPVTGEQDSGAVTGAVDQSAGGSTGPVAEPSGGVVAAGSGPVFDLATGQVGEGGGGVSGPLFDLVTGPVADLAGGTDTASAPSAGPTPGSGRLAAFLAESRGRLGGHPTADKPPQQTGAGSTEVASGPAPDGPPVTATVTPSPSVPASFVPVTAEPSGPADAASWSTDVATVRVPGAVVSQKIGPGFAATLLGLPGPEQEAIKAALDAVGKGPVATGRTVAGRERHATGGDRDGAGDRNSPLPMEGEGDATERNLTSPGDARAAAAGWSRSSDEKKRITQIVEVARPPGTSRLKMALVAGAGLMAITAMVIVGVARKASKTNRAAATAPAASPNPSEPPRPAALKLAPEEDPAPGAAAEAEARAQAAAAEAEQDRADTSLSRKETKALIDPEPSGLLGAEAERGPPRRDSSSSAQPGTGEGETKRKVARTETRRSETRHAETKTRRRSSEGRAGAKGQTPTAAAFEQPGEVPRPRLAQPSRGAEFDPDATLPLGTR